MGSLEYACVQERYTGHAARLLVAEAGGTVIAYPFFLRPVQGLPFAVGQPTPRWDIYTPEYTGPLRLGAPLPANAGFPDLVGATCRELGVIAEFAHLTPWAVEPALLDPDCVEPNREIVYVDLTWGEEAIWSRSLTSDARRMVKQAERAGVRVRRARSIEDVREFHRVHQLTMDRLQARSRYRFPADYFVSIHEAMPANAFFALAEYRDRVVAGGLFFHGGADVYWHLSAIDLEYAGVRPVDAYVFETLRQGAREGKRRLLCGGGHEAPDDGVFRFKSKFSPLRAQFRVYKRVHDPDAYAALNQAWSGHHGGRPARRDFFPAYRAALSPDAGVGSGELVLRAGPG
jgi:hypothetical protein